MPEPACVGVNRNFSVFNQEAILSNQKLPIKDFFVKFVIRQISSNERGMKIDWLSIQEMKDGLVLKFGQVLFVHKTVLI